MPTYHFACPSCGQSFEAFRGFAQGTDDVTCPDDGATAIQIYSPAANPFALGRPTRGADWADHGHEHAPGTPPHTH